MTGIYCMQLGPRSLSTYLSPSCRTLPISAACGLNLEHRVYILFLQKQSLELRGSEKIIVTWLFSCRKWTCIASQKWALGLINLIIPSKDFCTFKYILCAIYSIYYQKFYINSLLNMCCLKMAHSTWLKSCFSFKNVGKDIFPVQNLSFLPWAQDEAWNTCKNVL